MTVMRNEDPALPEKTEGETWYDAEIAPALAALAKRCHERSMSLVPNVDGYIMSLTRFCDASGVDTGASFVMRRLGG